MLSSSVVGVICKFKSRTCYFFIMDTNENSEELPTKTLINIFSSSGDESRINTL